MSLPFKIVAFDMDATFLRDDKGYDRERFARLLEELTARGVRLVVASGNQYECLANYFPETHSQLTFVAENGAHLVQPGKAPVRRTLDPAVASELIAYLTETMGLLPSLSGVSHGYLSSNLPPAQLKRQQFYFPNHILVTDYHHLPADRYYQLSFLIDPAQVDDQVENLKARFGDRVKVTPSGNGSVDLTVPGINKATGLATLLAEWGLTPADLVAFGDGGNDVAMLKLAGRGYAMANAAPAVKAVADQVTTLDNNHDGVLATLEALMD